MFSLKIFKPILAAAILSGCVSTGLVPDDYTGPIAVIADSSGPVVGPDMGWLNPRRLVTPPKVDLFFVAKIDGKTVQNIGSQVRARNYGRGFALTVKPYDREVPVQPLQLELSGYTHHAADIGALFGDVHTVNGTVSFTPKAGVRYVVRGSLSKEYSAIWVQTSGGSIVTSKVEKRR